MSKTINELLDEELGTPVRPSVNPLVAEVGTSAVQLLKNDPNRIAWLVINLSANALYILHQEDVSASNGMRVAPNGGSAFFNWRTDAHWLSWDWYAVASGSSSAILVIALVTT